MDLAPVLDIDGGSGPNNRDPDGTRSFSADATVASAAGRAFAAGLAAGGVIPVAKHFPGLGGASGNTDVTPGVTRPWARLQDAGLVPFADADRVGHARDHDRQRVGSRPHRRCRRASRPQSSAACCDDRLAYRGLVLTDSLSAAALTQHRLPGAPRRDRGGARGRGRHGPLQPSTGRADLAGLASGRDRHRGRDRDRRSHRPDQPGPPHERGHPHPGDQADRPLLRPLIRTARPGRIPIGSGA